MIQDETIHRNLFRYYNKTSTQEYKAYKGQKQCTGETLTKIVLVKIAANYDDISTEKH